MQLVLTILSALLVKLVSIQPDQVLVQDANVQINTMMMVPMLNVNLVYLVVRLVKIIQNVKHVKMIL